MASKRRLRRKACEGKKRYANPREALAAIAGLRRRNVNTDGYLAVYLCCFCNGFHLGHLKRSKKSH